MGFRGTFAFESDVPAVGDVGTFTVTEIIQRRPVWDRWPNGPESMPIVVPWAASSDLDNLRAIGVTHVLYPKSDTSTYVLDRARAEGMKIVMGYREYVLANYGDVVDGWFAEPDEPDGVTATDYSRIKASPTVINDRVRTIRAADPTRPVWLSLNMGVAWPGYIGRGPDAGKIEPYNSPDGYLSAADIVTFNVYPGSNTTEAHKFIWQNWELAATGIRNLIQWATDAGRNPDEMAFGHWCEAAPVRGLSPAGREPTAEEMRTQVRLSLAAGAQVIGFFPIRANAPIDSRYGIQSAVYREAMRSIIAEVRTQKETPQ